MSSSWTTVNLDGKTADIFDPSGPQKPRFGLLFLHAYDIQSLRCSSTYTRLLGELRIACVCPQGGYFWWVDRPCPEFDPRRTPERYLLDVVMPFFRDRWGLSSRAVGLLGFSMGGQAALRLAFKYSDRFPAVAALAPALEYHDLYGQGAPLDSLYDSKEQCRQDTAPMHVQPGHAPPHVFFACDPDDAFWYRGSDRLREKLLALGVEHQADLTTRAGGHTWQYFDALADQAVRFLYKGLEQQSLRLL